MPVTAFDPKKHGFHFANTFVNNVISLPGLAPLQTLGRCGGMAFAALDYYLHGLPIPKNSQLPADGTLLADYIYKRLIDSFSLSGAKFVTLTLAPDHATWFSKGETYWTKVEETANIRNNVDAGSPMILGLVAATNLADIGHNHQVVAYGYQNDADTMPVIIYDNNHPDQPVTLSTSPNDPHYHATTGEEYRGFFVEWYGPNMPDYLVPGTLLKEQADPVYVVYGGAKFWIPNPDTFNALGFAANSIRTVGNGSMAYIADVPGNGTLLRETSGAIWVVYGGAKFHVPDPATLTALFPNIPVYQLWDGALNGIPVSPDDGTLLRETSGAIWVVYGGAKFHVPDPATLTALFPSTPVFQLWDGALDNIPVSPVDGTLLRETDGAIWVVYAGAKFHVPDMPTLNALFANQPVVQLWDGALANIPEIPVEGSLFRETSSQQVYEIVNGHKLPAPATASGTVHVLWDGALAGIPDGITHLLPNIAPAHTIEPVALEH